MEGTDGISDGPLDMGAFFGRCRNGSLHVSNIVQCIINPNDIDSITHGLLDKLIDDIISEYPVACQSLTAKDHLQPGFFESPSKFTHPLPWIFVQIPKTGINRCTSPHFYRMKSHLVHNFSHR